MEAARPMQGVRMQRSVEQRQAPKRRGRRRDPRVQYFGFTAVQLPFIYVLVGNWLFSAAFFALTKLLWHWVQVDWTLGDRIAQMIKDAVFAILPALVAICIVAAQRLDPICGWAARPSPTRRSTSTHGSFSTRSSSSSSIS